MQAATSAPGSPQQEAELHHWQELWLLNDRSFAPDDPCSNNKLSQAQHSAVQGDFSLEDGSTNDEPELGPMRDRELLESCIRASLASEVLFGTCSSNCSESCVVLTQPNGLAEPGNKAL